MYNTDAKPKIDLLNREPFAKQIADSFINSFQNNENSFVFGINGKWGSGKTVLMDYLKASIRNIMVDRDHTLIIDFNPWMYSGKDELLTIFLQQITRALGPKAERLRRGIAGLAKAVAYLESVKYIDSRLGKFQKWVQGMLERASSKKSVTDLKDSVDAIITEEKFRLFVFIDDIDRLTPKEIVEIFQIIKLNASFKNTVFIVSYDKDVVQKVLYKQHGFDAGEYLEKIIQVDYRIPDLLDETVWQILLSELRQFFADQKISLDETKLGAFWSVYRLKYYFLNLRHVHRYVNALRVRYPSIKNNVKTIDFLVIEAIRIFDYGAYEIIQRDYKKEIQYGPHSNIKKVSERITNATTLELYKILFNQKNYVDGEFDIANPQYFDRYFGLVLRQADVKEETVNQYIDHSDSRRHLVENAIATGTVKSLMDRLKARNIGIELFLPLIKWASGTDQQFWDSREAFINLLLRIIVNSKDKIKVFKALVTELRFDDGHFNPARFYLAMNLSLSSKDNPIFGPYEEQVKGISEKAMEVELQMLKKHEGDFLIFPRQWYHTETFHRLFLMEYKSKYNATEYDEKLAKYISQQDNAVFFVRLIIPNLDNPVFEPYWAERLLNKMLLSELVGTISKISIATVDASDAQYLEAFTKYKKAIAAVVKR